MKNTTYHIPHKLTLAFLISSLSLNSFAQEKIEEKASEENKTNKHFFYAGVSSTSPALDDASSKSRNTSFNVGYHYRTDSGYVFGSYYNPSAISEKSAPSDEMSTSLETSVLGFYVGGSPFKKNKNLLVTGGFNIASTTFSAHIGNYKYEQSRRGLGGNLGLWYVGDRFFVGGRVSRQKVSIGSSDTSGSAVGLSLNSGFSF